MEQPFRGTALLDPRCKGLLLILLGFVSYFVNGEAVSLILVLGFALFVSLGNRAKWAAKMVVSYAVVSILSTLLKYVSIPVLSVMMSVFGVTILKFIPIVMVGNWILRTTHMDDLMVALQRMRLPQSVTIPLVVMFRYIPTLGIEYVEWLGQKENPDGKGWAAGAGYGEKILSILKGILGTAVGALPSAPAETEIWYRVRKTWADASSQKGAFKSLENAKKCADENPGYSVFDESGKVVYTKAAAFKPYLVRVSIPDLNIRRGPGTDHEKTGKYTGTGTFTIVEEADGKGASKWGLLKSYQSKRNGWVSLDYAKRVQLNI